MLSSQSRSVAIVAMASIGALALAAAVWIARGPKESPPVVTSEGTTRADAAPSAAPQAPRASAPASSSSSVATPSASAASALDLSSPDAFARRASIEAAMARKDVSALPALQAVDLRENGYVAAATIDAVGKLAAVAPEPARKDAVRTLERWLTQESKRARDPKLDEKGDARGNVSIVVDALADTKSPDAIAPLVAALDSGTQPLHVEIKIVQALDRLDARASAPSIERFAGRLKTRPTADDLERELVKEGLAAAEAALARWR